MAILFKSIMVFITAIGMKRSKMVFFVLIALIAPLSIINHLYGQELKPHLIIVLPGATPGLDPADLVKNPDKAPFLHEVHIFSASSGFDPTKTQGLNLYKTEEAIFKVFVHYPSGMDGITADQEIAQEFYIENAEKLMETAAETVGNIIKGFLNKTPQGYITIVAAGMSGEIVLKVLTNNSSAVDNVIFFYPTLGMVNNGKMINVLKEKGYSQEKAKVIAYENDPTIPRLEEQKHENVKVFRFLVIEAMDSGSPVGTLLNSKTLGSEP